MELIKDNILNKIQVAGEVNGALAENNMVIVTKSRGESPTYRVYAANPDDGAFTLQGEIKDGLIHSL